jgi:hypothetical protein
VRRHPTIRRRGVARRRRPRSIRPGVYRPRRGPARAWTAAA